MEKPGWPAIYTSCTIVLVTLIYWNICVPRAHEGENTEMGQRPKEMQQQLCSRQRNYERLDESTNSGS